ncbi:DUF5946 family protein [Pseudooceanicola sp. C21-150M6]|uniref:DUF5946 family protein n=1 Tax=Pseudooceanicola sp. C21-150M6 TaxID=3434355 RepID=UPI003D7FB258
MSVTRCPGCGASLPGRDGPVHEYMISSPACWALFGEVLAAEYADPALRDTHRLSVDTYAVQHPGAPSDRRAVQSVGLHLARLYRRLGSDMTPEETNAVMTGFVGRKESLIQLNPPTAFTMTVADIAPLIGGPGHSAAVRAWAERTWDDWAQHHDYIRDWADG